MKDQYKNILVAVDGSEQAYNAVREAIAITKRNDGKLWVLTVKETNRYYDTLDMSVTGTTALDKMASDILAKVTELVNGEVDLIDKDLYDGNAKRKIVQYAKDNEIDLIVIGATGTGVIDKLFIGSTTQYVVNHAPCNVMVVK
ncbi:universal stress protein [Lactococcus paracarnosus]|uniref:Universal stress protein n=1 Tax=Pseudolactococcus paracarnosus TaxID=2749962 RepID=A0A7L4WD93_9LACT|nr:universal stress protein [Lactococcus paracarnosus]SPC35374.1 Universal stress protein [Lactococcus piscium]MCJ1977586.1 universal stress protein [Lactococcus paracarnosus]MCJ1983729.1 universal stress protein [Lactococcus paracarnosus]MCJ1995017.1 universal stress protein [Lactococcus paracarnosus]MCJ1998323.1 universal stress protein [Lactococcus paracarnosus]